MNGPLFAIIGVLVGMLLMGLIVWFAMPSMMLVKHRSNQNYDEVVRKITEEVEKKQDWKMLKVNDYQASTAVFKDIEHICSMNVCNPRYASEILADDGNRGVTAFMPLAIGVYEDKQGQVFVSQLNVGLLGMMFGGTIAKVMKMAGSDIAEVVASISTK
jgi:uncharacterized protein (DUF302 family)